ncbi:hypothetical protein DYB34_006912 [Aphanomyces astaci]|uniref:Uncharacterized protein n=1 Tax=Aphanomyces astaci TaxID=112090 RepID=A0A418C6I1_APHAT|nr:hypothetical protein DYB34_006912 [Aphanomyces astaci]
MARQNKRNKNSNGDGQHRTSPTSNGDANGGEVKRTMYVQETWTEATGWELDDEVGQSSLVLLSVDVQSHVQLQVVKDILSTSIGQGDVSALDASCRLQTSNAAQLKLASHGIKATNRYEPNALKKLRSVVVWSLNQTSPLPSLHDDIAHTNRQGWTAPLSLRTLVLGWTPMGAQVVSTWSFASSIGQTSRDLPTLSPLYDTLQLVANTVVILRGRPGSGKSTLTRIAASLGYDVAVCSADAHFDSPWGYHYDKAQLPAAHDACRLAFHDALQQHVAVVVVDNTHSCLWEYEPYRTAAFEAGYRVVVVEVGCDDVTTAVRMGFRNSHGVGIDVMLRMHQRWEPHVSHASEVHVSHASEVHMLVPPAFSAADNRRAMALLLQGDIGDVYIAAVYFSDETKRTLLERFPPKHVNVIAEHMTLAFQPSKAFVASLALGQHVCLKVVQERFDAKGHCLKLQWVHNAVAVDCVGQRILHTTLSFAPDSAAYYSNALLLDDDNANIVCVQPPDQLEVEGLVGVALQSPYVPKWKKAKLLDLPRSTLTHSCDVVLVDVRGSDAIDQIAFVAELERVAGVGSTLVLLACDEVDCLWFTRRQIEFHHVIISRTMTLSASIKQVQTIVPDVAAITVVTLASSLVPVESLYKKLFLSIHSVERSITSDPLPRHDAMSTVFRQFLVDIQNLVDQSWRSVAGASYIDTVSHDHQANHFDMYLSATPDAIVALRTLQSRLVASFPSYMQTRQPRHCASDQVAFVDVHVSACYAVTFRLVLYVYPSETSPLVRSLHTMQELFHRRPRAIDAVLGWFMDVLHDIPLPFADVERSMRVLAACLARGYVHQHPRPEMEEFHRHMLDWTETDWLVCLAHKDADATALCHALHAPFEEDGGHHLAGTPRQLKDLELQVVRCILQKTAGAPVRELEWFAIAPAHGGGSQHWTRYLDDLDIRHRLSRAIPHQIVCN